MSNLAVFSWPTSFSLTSESLRGEDNQDHSLAPMNNTTVYDNNHNASRSDVSGIEKVRSDSFWESYFNRLKSCIGLGIN